jgi:hypothetical protein
VSIRKPDGVTCQVDMGDCSPFGEYANAFRVFADNDGELLLDICVYSARDNKAQCVARVRIPKTFLADIQGRIGRTLEGIKSNRDRSNAPTPIYLFRRPVDEDDDGGTEDN